MMKNHQFKFRAEKHIFCPELHISFPLVIWVVNPLVIYPSQEATPLTRPQGPVVLVYTWLLTDQIRTNAIESMRQKPPSFSWY